MKIKFFGVIIVIGVIVLLFTSIYAQDNKPAIKYKSREDCAQKFDINKIDFQTDIAAQKNISLLADYSRCVSCLDDDFYSKISFMPYVNDNKNNFVSYTMQYWIELFKNQEITEKLLDLCMKEDECTKEKCEKFAKAFKSNDTAVCKEDNDCKAVMLLDEDLTLKENRKDFIRFAKAIRDSSIKGCASINDETMRVSCEVYINKDKNACQRLLGFNRFQQEYCRDSCN